MIRYKRLLALGLIATLTLSLTACGKKNNVKYEPLEEDENVVYNFAFLQDEDNDYLNAITLGFQDSLTDLFGKGNINITKEITSDTQLVFANGSESLTKAADMTREIPIVGAGIMDYQHLLHLTAGIGDKWNRLTGRNITGVSSEPNMEAQTSLLIETAKDLKSVGLLYTPSDNDSLFQLEILEKYLDQAGIPWREYSLPSTELEEEETSEDESKVNPPIVITPTDVAASSATEGPNNNVEMLGGTNLIDGILAPNSAHAATQSSFWKSETTVPEDATFEEIVNQAADECSVLFIPTGSLLKDQLADITKLAVAKNVPTVAGDGVLGEDTVTSTYFDPYQLGYSAGKKAYRILVKGDDPGELKITTVDSAAVKLYNGKIAKKLEMEFPKSFKEIEEFKKTYIEGSSTSRITSEE